MAEKWTDRIKHAWNVFIGRKDNFAPSDIGVGSFYRPDRPRLTMGNDRTIVNSIFTRMAIDASAYNIRHIKCDDNGYFKSEVDSPLNRCFKINANIDQTGPSFVQDVVMSMLDEGVVAIVPTVTSSGPDAMSYGIEELRVGQITEWYPKHVKVKLYNDRTGLKEDIVLPKERVAIVENPFFSVVNEPNSVLQRLLRKLALIDVIDESNGSGKLDLIVQLPYTVRTELQKKQAKERQKDIEDQLKGSKYGIAYIDATEHVTQLNRPAENNLMKQIEYLTSMLFSQLGVTQSIMDGTADEQTMTNYLTRTIGPIVDAIVESLRWKFLTKTALSQNQTISYFRDQFKLVPIKDLIELSDKMTRNEIMTSNEVRQIIGLRPSDDPRANELRNKNISQSKEQEQSEPVPVFNNSES